MVFSTRLMLETKLHHLFVLIFLFPFPKYYNYFSKRIKKLFKTSSLQYYLTLTFLSLAENFLLIMVKRRKFMKEEFSQIFESGDKSEDEAAPQ